MKIQHTNEYRVGIHEHHISWIEVCGKNEEEAIANARKGIGDSCHYEFVDRLNLPEIVKLIGKDANMKKYKVEWCRTYYCHGSIEVEALSKDEAEEKAMSRSDEWEGGSMQGGDEDEVTCVTRLN